MTSTGAIDLLSFDVLARTGERMAQQQFRVGLMVPSSNTVMEPDFHRQLKDTCIISTDRMYLVDVTAAAEEVMLAEELPRSARALTSTDPQVLVFGCTSAGSLGGLRHDRDIARRVSQQTGVDTVTVLGAVLSQLELRAPSRVAVFTPYNDDLNGSVARCITEAGYEIVKTAGMGIVANREIGNVSPASIVKFVTSQMTGVKADAVFLSCTNWQAVDAMTEVEELLGVPIVTSNHATIEAVRERAISAALAPR
jgi:maleate isomerase